MGDIHLVTDVMPDLLPMLNRSPGLHISGIIHDLCVSMGLYKPRPNINQAQFELGNALEHAIIQRHHFDSPDRYIQPGELELDNLYGTPDLYDIQEEAIDEMKLTWMSSRRDPYSEKFWRYWVQLKAYCKMFGVVKGRLHVCFVNGAYRGDSSPQYRVWEQLFSARELTENWAMLVTRGKKMVEEGKVKVDG